MTVTRARSGTPASRTLDPRRAAPATVAAVLALGYVIVSPPSLDLAAHLLRAKLFTATGFAVWDNWWYGGHHTLGYSVLFPPVAAALTPQVAAALAAVGTAALFEPLARAHFGPRAWVGATWFGAATAVNLFTGRLAFAFGLLPAMGGVLALSRRRAGLAAGLGALSALCSPVAALFAALAGAAVAGSALIFGPRSVRPGAPLAAGTAFAAASLLPVVALTLAFPEGGTEPFALDNLLPVALLALAAVLLLPRSERVLRVGAALYGIGCVAAYASPNAAGSNVARLGLLIAGPLAALVWWRPGMGRRAAVTLAAAAAPLLYLQWQAPVRDVRNATSEGPISAAYYRPLLAFLHSRSGAPFRVEIPFTFLHWEAYRVAPSVPLARGWERQLDRRDNPLFYGGRLTADSYKQWLSRLAVRYVALPDTRLDASALAEAALIRSGLPYLTPVFHSAHWRVYEVRGATPLADGAARALTVGPSAITLRALKPGTSLVRVRYTPYWQLSRGAGCVSPAGELTRIRLRHAGIVTLAPSFALDRIGARTPRCN